MCSSIVEEILVTLKELGKNNENHKQSTLALELFWRIVIRADTNIKEVETLALNLWNLAHKHENCVDPKTSVFKIHICITLFTYVCMLLFFVLEQNYFIFRIGGQIYPDQG